MQHGGDLGEAASRFGGSDAAWLDLSTGINPHPWPVPDELRRTGWERLPSGSDLAHLIAAARTAYGVPPKAVIAAAPGTQTIIQWLPCLAPRRPVAIVGPTYTEHETVWRGHGFEVEQVRSLAEAGDGGRHVVVVNPNNPDGRVAGRAEILAAAANCRRHGTWLVVDESFADVEPGCSVVRDCGELPILVLRSFGKFYGLAGLRLGFAIAQPSIAEKVARALGLWPVSGPAIAVGTAALADTAWAAAMRGRLASEAEKLDALLAAAGLEVAGGTSLFRLVEHPRAGRLHEALASRRIWTRRFLWSPTLLRIGLPPDEAASVRLANGLSAALREIDAAYHDQGTRTGAP
ncbi:threonine-phosphate decarboxylase CobD [Enterovirga aerilata]|uniref:8-amino-7-oxononanoate synthase n=1 Tax=Enterovirga aerilata TaxID=2730920 RepID=A0A849I9W0_9HYPH|nr:threonine-phosphate decarboxylase CobD [Enterovirga sp. DB1703]NNM72860.1 threonine-phosphate decarboxylase [Enterovirga sp. DB1703]